MSTTEVVESEQTPITIKLKTGLTISYKSNESIEADEIPIIDISPIYSENFEDRKAVAEKVREACHRIGFFYAVNHGIDAKYPAATFEAGKRFFDQPMEKKMEVCTDLLPDEFVGYHPMSSYNRTGNKFSDLMEAYNFAYDAKYDPDTANKDEPSIGLWPKDEDLPGFKDKMYMYHTQLLGLARRLTRTFALALHMPENHFDDYVVHPEAGQRVCHYPIQERSRDEQVGIGAHTDFECFTFVTQDGNDGLEVLSKSGYWVKAKPIPGSLVVNVADCLMRQTNDFFVSTVHRVINQSGVERYSCPFFFGFDRTKALTPIPTCVSAENPMKYPVMTSGEYYKFRATTSKSSGY